MKKVIILFFTLAITLSSVRELVVYSNYYLNIEYISNQLCINVNQPELMCFGKCYLEDQLIHQASNSHEQSAKLMLDSKFNLFYESHTFSPSLLNIVNREGPSDLYQENLKLSSWLKEQFRPPIA